MKSNTNTTVKKLTCIRCPLGCSLEAKWNETERTVYSISGNTCQKGEEYARSECVHPERIVTSTVMSTSGIPVPVKTDRPIPKEKMYDCMRLINSTAIELPVDIGDVVAYNVYGSNIVVTAARH